jgi:outer membrane murein-binding lipoprotein Lpp
VKSFLSVIIVSTTLMLGALFFTTQLLPGADSLIPTLVDALERQIEGQNVKNEQLEILARKMVQIAASVQQLSEELAQSNNRFQSIGRCAAPRCDDFPRALPRERWRQL